MEQIITRASKRAGWSEKEAALLWETADEAQKQGLPLKSVFEQIAEKTGRRPNSIRNFYYAQARRTDGTSNISARFIPFTEEEVCHLVREVLIARAAGMSVRACLSRMSGGNHREMLRYQNKYRAVLKTRPEFVRTMVETLKAEGVNCQPPVVNHRTQRAAAADSAESLVRAGHHTMDPDVTRACETFRHLISVLENQRCFIAPALVQAAEALITPIKEFVSLPDEIQLTETPAFSTAMRERVSQLEALLPDSVVCCESAPTAGEKIT